MQLPLNANLTYVVFKLQGRGIPTDTIERSLREMIGSDWKYSQTSGWPQRLEERGLLYTRLKDIHALIDEIEILIHGRNKLFN